MKASVFSLIFLLSIMMLLAVKDTRQIVLLERINHQSGYQVSETTTDTFEYSDTLNGELLPVCFDRHYLEQWQNEPHEDTYYSYNIDNEVHGENNDIICDSHCTHADTGNLYYNQSYRRNSQGQLIHYSKSYSYLDSFEMSKFINTNTALVDSMILRFHYASTNNTYYKLYTYEYDSLDRVHISNVFSSSDSHNWVHDYIFTYEYGELLSNTIDLNCPDTFRELLYLYYFVDSRYQVVSALCVVVPYGNQTNIYYEYSSGTYPVYIDVSDEEAIYGFDQDGRLQYQNMDIGNEYRSITNYTWGEYVSNHDEIAVPNNIAAYPNPFRQSLTISLNSKDTSPTDISIYNIKGQLVRQWKSTSAKELVWDGKDTTGLPVSNGVYLIKTQQGYDTSVLKTIKID